MTENIIITREDETLTTKIKGVKYVRCDLVLESVALCGKRIPEGCAPNCPEKQYSICRSRNYNSFQNLE